MFWERRLKEWINKGGLLLILYAYILRERNKVYSNGFCIEVQLPLRPPKCCRLMLPTLSILSAKKHISVFTSMKSALFAECPFWQLNNADFPLRVPTVRKSVLLIITCNYVLWTNRETNSTANIQEVFFTDIFFLCWDCAMEMYHFHEWPVPDQHVASVNKFLFWFPNKE
jgi:hypothetical protein